MQANTVAAAARREPRRTRRAPGWRPAGALRRPTPTRTRRALSWAALIASVVGLVLLLNAVHLVESNRSVQRAMGGLGGSSSGRGESQRATAEGLIMSRAGRAGGRGGNPSSSSSSSGSSGGDAPCECPSPAPPVKALAAAPGDGAAAVGVAQGKEAETMAYLDKYVFKQPPQRRAPEPHFWLDKPTAKNATLALYRDKVREYLATPGFKQRLEALRQQKEHQRGIVISTGGPYYLPQAIVLLRTLRRDLNSTLPVEIFWHGDKEMDAASLEALKKEFAPLDGFDVTKLPYPSHHLPGATLVGFPMKPYALLHTRFQQALLLDCDIQLVRDPSYMFDTPEFKRHGNLFFGDIYNEGLVKNEAYDYVGLNRSVLALTNGGKGDFVRYAESGQLMVDRTRHLDALEWVWFLNAFGKGHVYEFMYGDKDTYALGFGLAGKGHEYQQLNIPPGGVFTQLHDLGWNPKREQMNKQGNWWLQALVHYDPSGEVLLFHRVTGEIRLGGKTPKDDVITPPMPLSWSMWWMGYGPTNTLQHTLDVMPFNLTALQGTAPAGQVCPLLLWTAYWTMRTHGIPTDRRQDLESSCGGALRAQYGTAGAAAIEKAGLLEHPLRLVVNKKWDDKVDGGWKQPKGPLLAVPLNMTAGYVLWQRMDAALQWANTWVPQNIPVLKRQHRTQRRRRLHAAAPWQAGAAPGAGGGSGGSGAA